MRYRQQLPQLDGELFLTDGGIETTLIFHEGLDLPEFAAFVLLDGDDGVDQLRRYYEPYLALARDGGTGLRAREPHLACQSGLGSSDRRVRGEARRPQPQGDRADGGAPRCGRQRWCSGGHQRLRGTAGRRLPPG